MKISTQYFPLIVTPCLRRSRQSTPLDDGDPPGPDDADTQPFASAPRNPAPTYSLPIIEHTVMLSMPCCRRASLLLEMDVSLLIASLRIFSSPLARVTSAVNESLIACYMSRETEEER